MNTAHTPPIPGQLYMIVDDIDEPGRDYDRALNTTLDIEAANVITSIVASNPTHHKLIIDLDLPAQLIPSSTEGHFHLYVDHEIEKEKYFKLLAALVEVGLVEEGYLAASAREGSTSVRLPWIKKGKPE